MLNEQSSHSAAIPGTAKVSCAPSDKNNVKYISHIAGVLLRRILSLFHPRNEIKRDTDFLGFEAFSSISTLAVESLPQVKAATKAKEPGFAKSNKESIPLKAA